MKRQILFVQGAGEGTYDEWDSKLVDSLREALGEGYEIRYPRMPNEDEPSYTDWKEALEREFETLGRGAILIGHSVGGTILVGVLAEQAPPANLCAVFLIASPFVGEGGWPSDDLRFSEGLGTQLPEGVPIFYYYGVEDDVVPASHVELFALAIPQAKVHRLQGRDHQLNNDLGEIAAAILALEEPGRV